MKKKILYIINSVLLMLYLPFSMVSCEDDTSTVNFPDQLFRPVLFEAIVNGDMVTFSWVPIANASYSLEVSKDSLLFSNDLQVFLLDEALEYTIEGLSSDSRYSARIKAVSKDSKIKDSEYKEITFMTGN